MHGINYTATECMGLMFEGKRNQQISAVNVLEFDKCHKKHNIAAHISRVLVGKFEQVFPCWVVWSIWVYKCSS